MNNNKNKYLIPIIIIGSLFFILGFITWLNGILISHLKTACELTDFQSLFVTFAFYISFTIMALPSSWILRKIGFKNGISISLWVMALGALIFIPAGITRVYSYFLTGLFVLGTGMALLQTAVNPYITILGPIESAAKRISIMGIANKIAGVIAPLLLAYFIIKDGDEAMIKSLPGLDIATREFKLDELANRVVNPYIIITIALFIIGLVIRFVKLPKINIEENEAKEDSKTNKKTNIFQFPYLILGVIALFFYVGVEVIAGDTIIRYGQTLGIPIEKAKLFTSFTLSAMLVGYVLGIILIPKIISQQKALQISAIMGVIFSLAAIFTSGYISIFFIAILGLANAIVWPAIWPLAIDKLGKFTHTGSALLIMAISGGAILPLFWGQISDLAKTSEFIIPQYAYFVMIPGYLFILFYAVKGYKIGKSN